jgi:hypothetical protein
MVSRFPSNQRGYETKKIFIDSEYEHSTSGTSVGNLALHLT